MSATPSEEHHCQSTNHPVPDACYGDLWQCAACGKWVCCQEGTTDDPDLCDTCWVQKHDCGPGCEFSIQRDKTHRCRFDEQSDLPLCLLSVYLCREDCIAEVRRYGRE